MTLGFGLYIGAGKGPGGEPPVDETAPSLSSPTATASGGTAANISVTSDEASGTLYYSILPAASAAPSAAAFIAGTTGGAATGSTNSPNAGSNGFSPTGLTSETAYKAHFFQRDAAGNNSAVVSSASFTTADVTAPTLSSPAGSATGSTTADLSVSTNEANGTLYAYASTSATPPSTTDLKAGTGAAFADSQAVASTGSKTFSATGLTAAVAYYPYFLHRDAAGNESTIAAGSSFTTDAATPPLTAVATDGWQATVDSPTNLSLDPVTVQRAGYDATGASTTHSDTLYLTKRVRQPWPNDASLTADQQALSDYVYSTDTISGVTNNSTEASPKPIANWIMPHRTVVGDTVDLEVAAFHRDARNGKQVACVIFSATDGTTTVTQTVATTAVSGRTGDKYPVVSYKASLDISTLSDNALITCNAKVYPWVGDASSIADSSGSSVAREFSPRYFLRNTTLLASPPVAYVSTSGSDVGGAASTDDATARAAPFATVAGAYSALADALDGAEIRIMDDGGTPFPIVPAFDTYVQNVASVTITRDPTVARANARVSQGASLARFRLGSTGTLTAPLTTGALRFKDIDIVRTGASTMAGEAATQLEITFEDVNFDMNGQSNTWLSNSHDYMFGVTFTNMGGANLLSAATYEHRCLRGVSATYASGSNIESWLVVGSSFNGIATMLFGTRAESGSIQAFNNLRTATASTFITFGSTADVSQVATVQNIFEWTTTTQGPAVGISHDDKTGDNTHVLLHNNTFAGAFNAGRMNIFYDEGSTPRTSKLMSVKGNIFVQVNTKSDVYRGANQGNPEGFTSGSPSTRTGNWSFEHGVGCAGNFSQYIDASEGGIGSSFAQDYPGLSCDIGTSSTVKNDPLFTDDNAATYNGTYGGGSGGGDYTLGGGSPAIGLLPVAVLSHNLAGSARPTSNDNAGAY